MRLTRIELQGFKSFPDKMSIDFVQEGVSIVVGPNGCGKSNVVDAIRWVLGEQRAKMLRGSAMEDVIFAGSASRAAVGLAQVSLFFSNPQHDTLKKYSEFSEISVTRKLYRSGESQYQINKTNCRLSDIRELFMDTGIGGKGYSIIEQGRIGQIVTSNPAERRGIIDEAAGIVKFKSKRIEAERKFDQSRQNLLRVKDILGELEVQEVTLKKQVAQAEAFLEAKGRYERLSQLIGAVRWGRLRDEGLELHTKRLALVAKQNDLNVEAQALDSKKGAIEAATAGQRAKLEELKEILGEKNRNAIRLEGKIESDQRELKNLEEWEQRGGQEKEQLEERQKTFAEQIEKLEDDIFAIVEESKEVKDQEAEILERLNVQAQMVERAKADIDALKEEEKELHGHKTGQGQEIEQILERAKELGEREEAATEKIEELKAKEKENVATTELVKIELEKKADQKEALGPRLETLKAKIEEEEELFDALDQQIEDAAREQSQAESRRQSIEEFLHGHEDYSQGAKTLLDFFEDNGRIREKLGFLGSLTDLIKAGESLPAETQGFIDRHFDLLIFKSASILPELSKFLETQEITYIEVCFLDLAPNGDSVESNLGRKIQWGANSFPLAEKTLCLTDPLAAVTLGALQSSLSVVGADGSIMTAEKIFCLGQKSQVSKADQLLGRRKELEELDAKYAKLSKQVIDLEKEEVKRKEVLEELDNLYEDTRKEQVDIDLELVQLQRNRQSAAEEEVRMHKQLEDLGKELAEAQAGQARFKERLKELEEGLDEKQDRFAKLAEELKILESKLEGAELKKQMIQAEEQQQKIKLVSFTERRESIVSLKVRVLEDIAMATERLSEIQKQNSTTKEKRERLTEEMEEAKAQLPKILEELKELDEARKVVADQVEDRLEEIKEIQKLIVAATKQISEVIEERHHLDIRMAQVTQEGDTLEVNLLEEQGIKPQEVLDTLDEEENFDVEKAEDEHRKLKRKVDNIDGVNLAAKAEYDALAERLVFLREQSQDLIDSIETLESSILEIDLESKRRFKETFKKVNENFKDLFPKLFGGGEAELRLVGDEDLLEAGVDIIAQPPGKKLQNMTLLSGGEKAMTAIALVFAIFKMKPSPFCLLDEVDAPLDDANNGRFNEQVKEMTANSQFIIITHNKKTMEIGDALFGVTMEEPGSSKIVSVDFSNPDEKFLAMAVS